MSEGNDGQYNPYQRYVERGKWVEARRVPEDGLPEEISTALGTTTADPGDWIVMDPEDGELMPCEDSVFRKTYEPEIEIVFDSSMSETEILAKLMELRERAQPLLDLIRAGEVALEIKREIAL